MSLLEQYSHHIYAMDLHVVLPSVKRVIVSSLVSWTIVCPYLTRTYAIRSCLSTSEPKFLVTGIQTHALMRKAPDFPVLWDKYGPRVLMHCIWSNCSLNGPKPSPKPPHACVHTYFYYPNLLLVLLVLFCPYDSLNLIMTPPLVPHVHWNSLWSNLGFTLGLMSLMGELVQSKPTICELIIFFVAPMVFCYPWYLAKVFHVIIAIYCSGFCSINKLMEIYSREVCQVYVSNYSLISCCL